MKEKDSLINKIVNECVDRLLSENSLNRTVSFMDQHDVACITAFRTKFEDETDKTLDDRPDSYKEALENGETTEPYMYSKSENKRRNADLKAILLKMGYGVTAVHGNWIENYRTLNAVESAEDTLFVVNLKDSPGFYSNLFDLSEYYGQDCFLYKPKDDDEAYNIGTNNANYPGYNNRQSVGKLHIQVENEFLTRVGNASFAFTENPHPKADMSDFNFAVRKSNRIAKAAKQQKLESYLHQNMKVLEDYQRGARMTINAIYEDYLINRGILF